MHRCLKEERERKRLETLERKKEAQKMLTEEVESIHTLKPPTSAKLTRADIQTQQDMMAAAGGWCFAYSLTTGVIHSRPCFPILNCELVIFTGHLLVAPPRGTSAVILPHIIIYVCFLPSSPSIHTPLRSTISSVFPYSLNY